jgi:hypothetical protein
VVNYVLLKNIVSGDTNEKPPWGPLGADRRGHCLQQITCGSCVRVEKIVRPRDDVLLLRLRALPMSSHTANGAAWSIAADDAHQITGCYMQRVCINSGGAQHPHQPCKICMTSVRTGVQSVGVHRQSVHLRPMVEAPTLRADGWGEGGAPELPIHLERLPAAISRLRQDSSGHMIGYSSQLHVLDWTGQPPYGFHTDVPLILNKVTPYSQHLKAVHHAVDIVQAVEDRLVELDMTDKPLMACH